MALFDDLTLGRYLPGDSLMHRVDPRLKLVLVPAFIAATFSFGTPAALALISLFALAMMASSRISAKIWWRGIWLFRWLFLFTLLLHLFFSPGRTLFGSAFLSRDGLAGGTIVVWQLILAVFFSSLLTLTAPPHALARALTRLLSPLEKLGVPVKAWGEFFLLILSFLPVLGEELATLPERRAATAAPGFLRRIKGLRNLLAPLLLGLVERGEGMAQALARGEPLRGDCSATELSPSFSGANVFFSAASALLFLGLLSLGR